MNFGRRRMSNDLKTLVLKNSFPLATKGLFGSSLAFVSVANEVLAITSVVTAKKEGFD